MDLLKYTDYRDCLREQLLQKKKSFPHRYTFQKMAEHCGIQKTYLSRVLKQNGQLSPDQCYLACGYLGLDQVAMDFVLLLREFNDCQVPSRKSFLQKKLNEIAQEELTSESHLSAVAATSIKGREDTDQLYFLDPWNQIVHLAMEIPRFAKAPELLVPLLNLSSKSLEDVLHWLEKNGFLKFEGGRWKSKTVHLHLPASSSMQRSYRKLMRLAALHRWEISQDQKDYGFSVLFTADAKTVRQIRKDILTLIQSAEAKVTKVKGDALVQMNIDLLEWL